MEAADIIQESISGEKSRDEFLKYHGQDFGPDTVWEYICDMQRQINYLERELIFLKYKTNDPDEAYLLMAKDMATRPPNYYVSFYRNWLENRLRKEDENQTR